jgi:hypothetical protein
MELEKPDISLVDGKNLRQLTVVVLLGNIVGKMDRVAAVLV